MPSIRAMEPATRELFEQRVSMLAAGGKSMRDTALILSGEFPGYGISFGTIQYIASARDLHFSGSTQSLERDIELFEQPYEFEELRITDAPDGYKIIIVNDVQFPFHDPKTLTAVENFWDEFKPDLEVFNGDMIDFYSISVFDKNPTRAFNLQNELDVGRGWLERRVTRHPEARRILDDGNHEDRLRRWLRKKGPEVASLRALKLNALLGLDEMGIEHLPYRSVIDFLGYRIEHGYKTSTSTAYPVNVSRYMAVGTGSSGLCGHSHRFSIYAWTDARGSHSYIENGCLSRFDLEYAPFPNWQQAFTYGIVHNNKVHLVPVLIYRDGFRAEGEFYRR